jgi:hypothetical protein
MCNDIIYRAFKCEECICGDIFTHKQVIIHRSHWVYLTSDDSFIVKVRN